MTAPAGQAALLIAHEDVFKPGGGVQLCVHEYIAALLAAGYSLQEIRFRFERGWRERLSNRLIRPVSQTPFPRDLFDRIRESAARTGATTAFFGINLSADLSRRLRAELPQLRQVLLSQGVESLDYAIAMRLKQAAEGTTPAAAKWRLGDQIFRESEQRALVDAVITLSPLDAEIEKWLGAARVCWLPRTIIEAPLDARPVDGRVGCVARLDHPPNRDGLEILFAALAARAPSDLRFRLVGGPASAGEALASRHRFVDYLGALDEPALRAEAATWCCFVNPLFVYAKGASTKLAVGLGWHLPIATTAYGARGYVWDESALPLAKDAQELARLVAERSRLASYERHRAQTLAIAARSPSISQVALQARDFLGA
jgi:hypothetical protein